MADGVRRLLLTGSESRALVRFQMLSASRVNWIESRPTKGREEESTTMLGTVFADDFPAILNLAQSPAGQGLVLQEIQFKGDEETYNLLHGEEALGWPNR